jgi:hypothetical protein
MMKPCTQPPYPPTYLSAKLMSSAPALLGLAGNIVTASKRRFGCGTSILAFWLKQMSGGLNMKT